MAASDDDDDDEAMMAGDRRLDRASDDEDDVAAEAEADCADRAAPRSSRDLSADCEGGGAGRATAGAALERERDLQTSKTFNSSMCVSQHSHASQRLKKIWARRVSLLESLETRLRHTPCASKHSKRTHSEKTPRPDVGAPGVGLAVVDGPSSDLVR